MAVRRVPRSGPTFVDGAGDFRSAVAMGIGPNDPVSIRFFRYVPGNPGPLGWRPRAENTVEIFVKDATRAQDLNSGEELARRTLAALSSGALSGEEAPYVDPPKPEVVQQIEHPVRLLVATILDVSGEYEVRIAGYVPNGFTLPVTTPSFSSDPDFEWGQMNLEERLLADTLEEAVVLANTELERFANSDAPIKDR